MAIDDAVLSRVGSAVSVLRAGGIIAYPTETFYGLGASVQSDAALDKLWTLKARDRSRPFLLLIARSVLAADLGTKEALSHPLYHALSLAFWPGPLTLVVDAQQNLHPSVVGPDGGVALRVSSHPVATALASQLGCALTSTSANLPSRPPAVCVSDLSNDGLIDSLDFVLDAGQTSGDQPSTIVRLTGDTATLLRSGAVSADSIERVLDRFNAVLGP